MKDILTILSTMLSTQTELTNAWLVMDSTIMLETYLHVREKSVITIQAYL